MDKFNFSNELNKGLPVNESEKARKWYENTTNTNTFSVKTTIVFNGECTCKCGCSRNIRRSGDWTGAVPDEDKVCTQCERDCRAKKIFYG